LWSKPQRSQSASETRNPICDVTSQKSHFENLKPEAQYAKSCI
jgi:hypothetical protein